MTFRVAAVAFAASALFTAPATAETTSAARVQFETRHGPDGYRVVEVGHDSHYRRSDYRRRSDRHRLNRYGQTRWEERELRSDAAYACREELDRIAWRIGLDDVDIDNRSHVEQVGRYSFVTEYTVEIEGRRRDYERDVLCVVERGEVTELSGMPDSRHYRIGRGYSDDYRRNYQQRYGKFSEQNWQEYDGQHAGHNHARGEECATDAQRQGGPY